MTSPGLRHCKALADSIEFGVLGKRGTLRLNRACTIKFHSHLSLTFSDASVYYAQVITVSGATIPSYPTIATEKIGFNNGGLKFRRFS